MLLLSSQAVKFYPHNSNENAARVPPRHMNEKRRIMKRTKKKCMKLIMKGTEKKERQIQRLD
jgi:hypothetical protein